MEGFNGSSCKQNNSKMIIDTDRMGTERSPSLLSDSELAIFIN